MPADDLFKNAHRAIGGVTENNDLVVQHFHLLEQF
jgi:hypothetical protein